MFELSSGMPVNPQAARDYQRTRQLGIGDLLLENRIIFLDGPIYDSNANLIVMKLLYLQSENKHQDIHFYINSPGGSVTATLAIYDTMQYLDPEVCTYCVGLAASGGAILMAGRGQGETLHPPPCQDDDPPAIRVSRRAGQRHRNPARGKSSRPGRHSIASLADHTGQAIDVIARDTERDRYLNAMQAKEYGLVDDVVTKKSDKKPASQGVNRIEAILKNEAASTHRAGPRRDGELAQETHHATDSLCD